MEPFGTVIIVVALVAVAVACLSYIGSGAIYRGLGRTGMTTLGEPDPRPDPAPGTAASRAQASEEIRQMVEAKSARRQARGEPPLDVDAEIAALTSLGVGGGDPALREEVRQLVLARNERRMRRGEAPVDVETEVARRLRELGA